LFAKFLEGVYVSEGEPVLENVSHKVSLVQLTQTAVEEAILGLNEQKGLGPDGISLSLLRKLVSVVKAPLTFLFNMSLLTGIFPAV
jgi:hypothetical protein